jgi:RHS repeat-associated protein
MAGTTFIFVGDNVIGESTSGVISDYAVDAFGSTSKVINTSTQSTNAYAYDPYGNVAAETGSNGDPRYMWRGGAGYFQTTLSIPTTQMLARHYSSSDYRWLSADPAYADYSWYSYCMGNPCSFTDLSGLQVNTDNCPPPSPPPNAPPCDCDHQGGYTVERDWPGPETIKVVGTLDFGIAGGVLVVEVHGSIIVNQYEVTNCITHVEQTYNCHCSPCVPLCGSIAVCKQDKGPLRFCKREQMDYYWQWGSFKLETQKCWTNFGSAPGCTGQHCIGWTQNVLNWVKNIACCQMKLGCKC